MTEGDGSQIGDPLRVTPSFIIKEKEELVFAVEVRQSDRTLNAAAELIASQLRPRNTIAGFRVNCSVVEKCVRRSQRGTVEFAHLTVEKVAAAFSYHLYLAAAAATVIRARIGRNGSEFLNRINGSVADRGKCLVGSLVISVNSINSDISLVSARACDGAYTIAGQCPSPGPQIISDNTGLQSQERSRRIAKLNR